MKQIVFFIAVLLFVGCKKDAEGESITITSNELKETVAYLSSNELQGRRTGSDGIDKAATYIEDQFNSYGVVPYFESFRSQFAIDSLNAFNVVGYLEGKDETLKNEFIIIGAHYDHIGFGRPVANDSIANGANDNATGTAAVLAMAKYFAAKKNNKRSIMFALFTAEEMGLLGSKHLAETLKAKNLDLYTLINFEMVGVPLKDLDYTAFVTGYELSNMGEKMNAYLNQENYFGASEVSKKYQLFRRSDNYPFYSEFKVPSHTISSCDLTNFDYYHHVDDEIEEMDFEFMATLINQTIPAVERMANSETKEIQMNANEG
ncbi:M20/M25/M40 family metallo-hydrolase [Psychroserpens sp. XS_ASV72]|uniref:M28 family metallopeptidase n=1 Tax=Psychroserpens sp. XS_ASV72 TaxID=3241293 RepID=UPI003516F3FF